MNESRKKRTRMQSGQAIVEFILMLLITVVALGTVSMVLKTSVGKYWAFVTNRVALCCGPCPDCKPASEVQY